MHQPHAIDGTRSDAADRIDAGPIRTVDCDGAA
jgi:hypothetical protein